MEASPDPVDTDLRRKLFQQREIYRLVERLIGARDLDLPPQPMEILHELCDANYAATAKWRELRGQHEDSAI